MANTRKLTIEILGKDKSEQSVNSAERNTSRLGESIQSVGRIAAGVLAAGVIQEGFSRLAQGFSSSVEAASSLGESMNAVNVIFGESSAKIQDWGANNAASLGLSTRAFNELATPLGAMFKNAGFSMDETAGHTIALTERAADMASVFNTDVSEALSAIQAGLRGESDPLERFGVGLSAAKVEAHALAMTGKDVAKSLSDQELAAARVSLIMEQTAAVQGDFANTSDGLANSQRIAAAEMENMQAEIGTKLMPIQLAWTKAKLDATRALAEKLVPAMESAYGWISAKLGPAMETGRGIVDRLRESFSSTGEGTQQLQDKFAPLIESGQKLWASLSEGVDRVMPVVREFQERFGELWVDLYPKIQATGEQIVSAVSSVLDFLSALFTVVTQTISFVWTNFGEGLWKIIESTVMTIIGVLQGAFQVIQGVFTFLTGLLTGDWSKMKEGLVQIWDGLWKIVGSLVEGAVGVVQGLMSILWRGVQMAWSYVVDATENARNRFTSAVSNLKSNAIAIVQGLWSSITEKFWAGVNAIASAGESARSRVSGAFDSLRSAVSSAVGNVADTARELPGRILSALDSLPGRMKSAGLEAIRAVGRGIEDGAGWVKDKVKDAVRSITRLLPGSPVKEGPLRVINRGYAGRQIVRMIAGGIESEEGRLSGTLSRVLREPVDRTHRVTTFRPNASRPGAAVTDGYGSVYIDMRGAVTPDSRSVEDMVTNALSRVGRRSNGRLTIAGSRLA